MNISIDFKAAENKLRDALVSAKHGRSLPVEWVSYTRSVFALSAKTWTPALATMLLAKAVDDRLDALSLKVDERSEGSYSARGLCHRVIVPAAAEGTFSIRNTGREPMNNQPFFRYSRIDELERVRDERERDFFVDVARKVNELSAGEAFDALAAFLSVAIEETARVKKIKIRVDGFDPESARIAAVDFLRTEADDRPQ
eukprot:Nk52_evm1s1310 gene=Nk52_evmTU1s1310